MTETTIKSECPRCHSPRLSLYMQGDCSFTFGGPGVEQSTSIDSDSFIALTCLDCDLQLEQDPGDGRVRRAVMREEDPPEYEERMIELAYALIERAQDSVGMND